MLYQQSIDSNNAVPPSRGHRREAVQQLRRSADGCTCLSVLLFLFSLLHNVRCGALVRWLVAGEVITEGMAERRRQKDAYLFNLDHFSILFQVCCACL